MSCHPQSESLPVGGGQVGQEPDYKQSSKERKEVRAKTIKDNNLIMTQKLDTHLALNSGDYLQMNLGCCVA